MTIYDKGLIRAMKKEYKDNGYYVAMTETGMLIQSEGWGVEITADAVPNSIKSLIVLHNGGLPRMDSAVYIHKNECGEVILETVLATMEDLAKAYTANGGSGIKPTRLTMDGCRVWQTTDRLQIKLVDVDDQQILAGQSVDAYLVSGTVYGRNWFGSMYILTGRKSQPALSVTEDELRHLINDTIAYIWRLEERGLHDSDGYISRKALLKKLKQFEQDHFPQLEHCDG